MIYARILGSGSYLPANIMTNDDLAKIVDTNDEWIRTRTGIAQRHIVADGEFTSDLAVGAAKKAFESSNVKADEIDLILLATATPDTTFPSTATIVQGKLGCKNAAAMDLQAACSGFVYGLHLADSLIKSGSAKKILLIGAETMSKVVDWQDRNTCILFGDGAGAVVISADEVAGGEPNSRGILYSEIKSDGTLCDILATDGGVSSTKTAGALFMEGKEVFRHAVAKMSESAANAVAKAGLESDDIDWVIPHQANDRILTSCMKKLGLPQEKLISTVAIHANTSSASIPLAIDHSVGQGKIVDENILVLPALGAGLTWGTCIIRW